MNPFWRVDGYRIRNRPRDPGMYVILKADLKDGDETLRRVELTASPTGKNIHVYVDGKKYKEAK
jgi:hypothetical protein